jgi:hypothetical protein
MQKRENLRRTGYILLAIGSAWVTLIFRPLWPFMWNVDRSRPLLVSNTFVDENESLAKTILVTDDKKEKISDFASTVAFFDDFIVVSRQKDIFIVSNNGKIENIEFPQTKEYGLRGVHLVPYYLSHKGESLIVKSCLLGGNPSDVYEKKDNVLKPEEDTPPLGYTRIPYSIVYSYDFKAKKWQSIPEDGGKYYPSIKGYVVRKDFRRLVLEVPGKPDEILLEDPEKKELWLRAWDYDPINKALVWIPKDSHDVVYYRDLKKSWTSSVAGYGGFG